MINWVKHLFHRKDRYETVINRKDVQISTLLRWFLYDTGLGDPNEIAVAIGLNPVSAEGEDKELEDSKLRFDSIEYLLPFLEVLSEISSNVMSTIQIQELIKETGRSEAELEHDTELINKMYRVLSLASLVAGFGAAFDIGLISQGDVFQTHTEEAYE